jgi:hypothetical protein
MQNIGDFSLRAVYRVTRVTNYYRDGQYTQTLGAFYDPNTNSEMLAEELLRGYVNDIQTGATTPPTDGTNQTDNDGDGVVDNSGGGSSSPLDPSATGSDSPGNHALAANVRPELNSVLSSVGDELGITVQTTSGNRGPGGSGRHDGYASDVALFSGGRRLSVANPADRALIQNFTQGFLNETRSRGLLPGVGVADHTAPSSSWYMNGNAFHYDIAGSFIGSSRSTYWGNGETGSGAPNWLRDMF